MYKLVLEDGFPTPPYSQTLVTDFAGVGAVNKF